MARELKVRNPRSGEFDHIVSPPDPAAFDAACARLRAGQPGWAASGHEDRARILSEWAVRVAADQAIVGALSADTGRRLIAMVEAGSLPGLVARWAAAASELLEVSGERASATPGFAVREQLIPYQLVGVISPWNFPLLLSMIDAIPALMSGCAVMIKPSEVTPRFIEPLRESIAASAELSAVLDVVAGDGETGAGLIERVDAVAFTGSVATGRKVAEACARRFIPSFLELGGKDPAIVLPSADPSEAARIVLRASVQATGQACQSLERVYVHESHLDAFVDALVDQAEQVQFSYPDISSGHIGPLIFDRQADIIAEHVADAVANGAVVRCGGEIEQLGGGLWVRPTVLTGVNHSMKVMREETFGPVIPVMAYRDIDEAIALANDTDFGLTASVIGPDVEEADRVARRINSGAVGINDGAVTAEVWDAAHDSFGFSGLGQSRMGPSGMLRYMRRKAMVIRTEPARGVESLDEAQA